MPSPHPIIVELRTRRLAAGVSQRFIARNIHYSHASVTFWESGLNRPCLDAVAAYAAVLGYQVVLDGSRDPIIDVLRRHRLDAGLTQAYIAIKLDTTIDTVNRRENGRRSLTVAAATAYAALFGLELELVVADA